MTTQVSDKNQPSVETLIPTEIIIPIATAADPVETSAPEWLGGEINVIGKSIAADYQSTSYEQVMTWFCNGATFADIRIALETETLVDTSAGEMLQMLAVGFAWEEIWLIAGLTD